MRGELIFILLLIVGLLALTAIRYRKQITTMISVARMLRQAKKGMSQAPSAMPDRTETKSMLVNCSKCDIWVPQDKAVKFREGYICSTVCQNASLKQDQHS